MSAEGSGAECVASVRAFQPTQARNFFRSSRICPDGSSVLLLNGEDRNLSLYSLPAGDDAISSFDHEWNLKPSDSILDFEWFPGASANNPSMNSFVLSTKDHPVHLLDGLDQRLRASYPIIDHRERFIAPHTMAFSADGTTLYCGFENAIEIFDVACSGDAGTRLKTTPSRSSADGQKGIISTISLSKNRGIFAAGSFSGTIGIYDASAGDSCLISVLPSSQSGGLTKVAFNPGSDLLYSASRLSDCIEVWDIRFASDALAKIQRKGQTNQRLDFDVDATGNLLAVGDSDGTVSIYSSNFDQINMEPARVIKISQDGEGVGGVVFLPNQSQLLTCAGSRRFATNDEDEETDSDCDDLEEIQEEDSLKLWNLL